MMNNSCDSVLTFWFEDTRPYQWWNRDADFDEKIRQRFEKLLLQAAQGELHRWRREERGRLAEIIVLDQFSRNVFRDTPGAFAQDGMALALAQEAVAADVHRRLSADECTFLLMPYMHSESRYIHQQAVQLFAEFTPPENYDFEVRHKAIVDRFGRYPHRNDILGRTSTPEELEFLTQPGSSF